MRPDVAALFREVADRSPADREAYYTRERVAEALRAEVESLLQYDAAGDSLRGYVASAERLLLESSSSGEAASERSIRGAPETIGRFSVTKLLGRGGMGEVYLARDPLIDRLVAIKLIAGREGDTARHLVREARAAGRLHHPNIVTVFEAGEHEGRSYIAMEYVPGETVGSLIRRRAPLSLRRRLEIIEGACAGLAHAHRERVIHLDIKPDNLMLDDAGIVKVLDFGISRVLQSDTLATMHGAGTLRYMSPEQIQGHALDHRSDVFSLGCSLFELVSFTPAFTGSTKEIVTQIAGGPIPSLRDLSPDIDPRLHDIVSRAMALEPSERYDDLDTMRAELAQVRAGIDPDDDEAQPSSLAGVASARPMPQTAAASRPRGFARSRARMTAIAASVLLAAVIAVVAWRARSGGVPDSAPAPAPVPVATVSARAPVVEPPPAAPDDARTRTANPRAGQAADPYERSSAQPARGNPAPVDPQSQVPVDVAAPAAKVPEPPSPAPEPPQPAPPAPVAAAPTLAAERTPAANPAPPQESPSDSQTILDTLRRYDAAYRSLDVAALLRVFPSLGDAQVEQLRRTFAGMSAYEMDTHAVNVGVTGDSATVRARVARRMTPRVGRPVVNEVEAEIRLQRAAAGWVILSVTAR